MRGREGAGTVVVSTSTFYERCQPLMACTLATLTFAQRGPAAWLASLAFGRLIRRYVDLEAANLKSRSERGR